MLVTALFVASVFPSGRMRINLNVGWQFANVPSAPGQWTFPDAVPTSAWKVMSVDSEERIRENGKASNAFDGDLGSIWHTEWGKHQPGYPHEIVIDLGSKTEAVGIRVLPRQTGPPNGRPRNLSVYLSNTADRWGTPVVRLKATNGSSVTGGRFPGRSARFLRVVFEDGQTSEPFLALSEIGLIRSIDSKARKDWESQFNLALVDVGADRFELTGDRLEKVKKAEVSRIRRWSSATLPHTPWIRPLESKAIWQGVTYYRRTFDSVPGRRMELTLEGAMQLSDLWLNGRHVASRRGGYLPMVVDFTGRLRAHNEILVRVDNSDNPLIPPGKPQQELDFMYGCGLYRNAYLTVTNDLYVTDPMLENLTRSGGIYITYPSVDASRAVVRVRTHVRNASAVARTFELRQSLLEGNQLVASSYGAMKLGAGAASQASQDIEVTRPLLWSPTNPHLYRLITTIEKQGEVIDRIESTVGVRGVSASRAGGFVLNGKPLRLIGTNRHQDYPWIGIALSDEAQWRDAMLIKRAGHNIVRLSHYPHSPAFMDACDHLGIMTIPCIPGWQFMNKDLRFKERVLQDIRELIRRDRNHPSAVFWEASLNETYPTQEVAELWHETAKSESLDGRILTAGDALTGAPWDVAYNQWRDKDMTRPQDAAPNRPGYIREYGDYEFGGAHSSSRVRYADGPSALLQQVWNEVWSLNRYRAQYPWTMGEGTWVMFDHNVPWDFSVSACGLADLFRREKPAFWFFQSQASVKPYLRLFRVGQKVVAFTNCDQVALEGLGVKSPAHGASTAYAAATPFDGSNTEHLLHPPIVFDRVSENASLIAVGYSNGRPVARDSAPVPGKPARVKVWIDDLRIPLAADGADVVFVRATVVDRQGNTIPTAKGHVRFAATPPGSIAGQPDVPLEMGVASNLVRGGLAPARLTVTARWLGSNLPPAKLFLHSAKPLLRR